MDDTDSILLKLFVQGEKLTGRNETLALSLEHNEQDIKEHKENLSKYKESSDAALERFKKTVWDKMNENTRLIGVLDKAQGKLIVKLGFWPKILVCVSTLLGVVTTIIALYKIGVAP